VTKIEKLIIGKILYFLYFFLFNISVQLPKKTSSFWARQFGLPVSGHSTKPVFILPLIPGNVAEGLLGFTLAEAEAHPGRFAAWRAYCEHAVGDFGVRVCVSPDGAVREYHVIATEVRPLPLTCVSRDSAT
jgi:hypothetical protein